MEQAQPSSSQDKPPITKNDYPEPLIISPSIDHAHSIILLHGRGDNGSRFGLEFVKSRTSSGKTLRELFPGTKWIFPTARKRRSTVLKRLPINQWFDNFSLKDPSVRQDLQYDGLQETSTFIYGLIREEAKVVGIRNVVIGGLSQGCAMSLQICLNYEPFPLEHTVENAAEKHGAVSLGGFIGMSGWLPFFHDISIAAAATREDQGKEEDPLANAESLETREEFDNSPQARQLRVANFVRDIVNLDPLDKGFIPSFSHIPYFLGHGTADETVSARLGEKARDVLVQLGLDVTWKSYQDFGHWYKEPDEIDDITQFLREKVGIT